MKHSKIIISLILGSFVMLPFHFTWAATVSEETPVTTEDMQTSQSTETQITGDTQSGLSNEASDWLSQNLKDQDYSCFGVDTSYFTLASKPDGIGAVNQEYTALLEQFTKEGYGEAAKLDEAKLSEYTKDAQSIFTDTYGNLAEKMKITTPKIPKSVNSSSYLKKAKKARDKAYKKQKKSSTYKKVKKGVNSSASLKKAKNKI